MTKEQFKNLVQQKVLVLDGATGSNLQKAGMPRNVCPEKWILEHSDVLVDLQVEYIQAGSNIVYAPTFSCNRVMLEKYGMADKLYKWNRELVDLSKKAVAMTGYRAYVAGNLTMLGMQLEPNGDVEFEEAVNIYKEQIEALVAAGVDLLAIETMVSLEEARAALIAASEVCDLPVMISMTFDKNGKNSCGTTPQAAVVTLQSLGADAVGINCSTGPADVIVLVEKMVQYAKVPIFAKPSVGMPEYVEEKAVYEMLPEEFAEYGRGLVEAGAGMVGGCCGTTPSHIMALSQMVRLLNVPIIESKTQALICSVSNVLEMKKDGLFSVIGECVNEKQEETRSKKTKEDSDKKLREIAKRQQEKGARALYVKNLEDVDEKEWMQCALQAVCNETDLPLCIESSDVDVVEHILRIYPGRALVYCTSMEEPEGSNLLYVVKKYGAVLVLSSAELVDMPIDQKKERFQMDYEKVIAMGILKENILIDGLVTALDQSEMCVENTLEWIRYCAKEMQMPTICKVSGVSQAYPGRSYLNAAFLSMAMQNGLNVAIVDASQDFVMYVAFASELLLNKDGSDVQYIKRVKSISN